MQVEMWTYRGEVDPVDDVDLSGFEVEAADGHVGKIVDAAYELGASWLVVDTGPWILGKKVLLPAGTVKSTMRLNLLPGSMDSRSARMAAVTSGFLPTISAFFSSVGGAETSQVMANAASMNDPIPTDCC